MADVIQSVQTLRFSETQKSTGKLIGKVVVQPETAVPGQPVFVQVLDLDGKPIVDPAVNVIVQGTPTSSLYCQFAAAGTHSIFVSATKGDLTDSATVSLPVTGAALGFRKSLASPVVTEIPILQVETKLGAPYTANLKLGVTNGARRIAAAAIVKARPTVTGAPRGTVTTPPVIKKTAATLDAKPATQGAPEATSYKWDFGDGTTATTQVANVSHDYFPAIEAGDLARGFDVTCTVVHDNITVKRTLLLHSSYGMSRQIGVVIPPVTGATRTAKFQHMAFSASMVVHNLESAPITLTAAAYVAFSDDRSVVPKAPKFVTFKTPIVLDAKSATALGVYIPLADLQIAGAVVNGFTAYYTGEVKDSSGKTMPVRLSYAFRIALSDSGFVNAGPADILTAANWDFGAALGAISATAAGPTNAVSKDGAQLADAASGTVAVHLSADPAASATLAKAREAIEAGLTAIALKNGAISSKGVPVVLPKPSTGQAVPVPRIDLITINPLDPPPVKEGNQCYPDDISDVDLSEANAQELVCQLTGDAQTVTIPSQFQNALQGDIILSPAPSGDGDLIAALFSVLTPPQTHSHSGMMTANFAEITHNTAANSRYTGSLTTDDLGIPTGIQPAALQYGWPGSLTQSIDDATDTVYLADPSGTAYPLSSFDTDQQGNPFSLIYPLVVKPLPEHEQTVRGTLRKAADIARSKGAQYTPGGTQDKPATLQQKGGCYYSFFAYTDPQLSAGFGDPAGADAPKWAVGLSPAVCSSFCWMSLKEAGVPLVTTAEFETLSDFSASAIGNGARVGAATLDGLIYYPQAERATGGQMLYKVLMEQALNAEDGFGTLFGGGVNDLIAGPIANQVLNAFASGNFDLQSNAWQTPGDGNAVSPDNIRLWNPPYYGYTEPLQYLPAHPETYTASKWTKVISRGSIKGTVTNDGAAIANVHVSLTDAPGYSTLTDEKGNYSLENIAVGRYALKARVVTTTSGITGERNNGNEGEPIAITAEDPNVVKNIELGGQLESFRRMRVDYDINGNHADRFSQKTGFLQQGPYTNSADVEPGTLSNTVTYTYDYNGGGYYNVKFTWQAYLQSDNAIYVALNVVMNSDNTGSDQVVGTPWSAVVEKGKSVSASFSGLHYSYDGVFTSYENGPVNYSFTVTNEQQTG